MRLVVLDPSGNFTEGSGTTGFAVFDGDDLLDFGDVAAKKYNNIEGYWHGVYTKMKEYGPEVIVCESFELFAHKSKQQAWSVLETPQIIGFLRMMAFYDGVPFLFQAPKIKTRFKDEVLEATGFIQPGTNGNRKIYYLHGKMTNLHQRDAIRHGLYALKYNKELKQLAISQ